MPFESPEYFNDAVDCSPEFSQLLLFNGLPDSWDRKRFRRGAHEQALPVSFLKFIAESPYRGLSAKKPPDIAVFLRITLIEHA